MTWRVEVQIDDVGSWSNDSEHDLRSQAEAAAAKITDVPKRVVEVRTWRDPQIVEVQYRFDRATEIGEVLGLPLTDGPKTYGPNQLVGFELDNTLDPPAAIEIFIDPVEQKA